MKGLLVHIIVSKDWGDCSNGGLSSRHKSVILVGPGVPEIFEPTPDTPAVKLVERTLCGKLYRHVEPVNPPEHLGWMMGGAFVHTSDGRFPNDYPLPLHDRQETQEQYNQLSQ